MVSTFSQDIRFFPETNIRLVACETEVNLGTQQYFYIRDYVKKSLPSLLHFKWLAGNRTKYF